MFCQHQPNDVPKAITSYWMCLARGLSQLLRGPSPIAGQEVVGRLIPCCSHCGVAPGAFPEYFSGTIQPEMRIWP
jgi:hypothetical protein